MKNLIRYYLFFALLILPVISKADNTTMIIITTSGTGLSSDSWRYCGSGNSLEESIIKENWDEGRRITTIGYTSRGWFFSLSKGTDYNMQSYKYTSSWPDAYVQQKRKEGYMITSIGANDTNWVVVTSTNTGITDQMICSAPWSNLKPWIKEMWDKDFRITDIAFHKGLWTIVMSKTATVPSQSYMWATSADDIAKKIKDYWDKGYIIKALEYGGGEFFCIMDKTDSSVSQGQSRFIKNSEAPNSFIQEAWDKGWNITYIGG